MPPVARITDLCTNGCPAVQGSPNVFVNNLNWHRLFDKWACKAVLIKGSSTVFINNLEAGRLHDPTSCGARVATASPNTFCGP
jgi:uncharacterized Zn-binding protein involved in type VI secretion